MCRPDVTESLAAFADENGLASPPAWKLLALTTTVHRCIAEIALAVKCPFLAFIAIWKHAYTVLISVFIRPDLQVIA